MRRICGEWQRRRRHFRARCSVESKALQGIDSLLSSCRCGGSSGGDTGHRQARRDQRGLLAAAIVAINRPEVRERLRAFRAEQTSAVLAQPDPAHE